MEDNKTEQTEKGTEEKVIVDAALDLSKMSKGELKSFADSLSAENESLKKQASDALGEAEKCKKVALQAAEFQTLYSRIKADFDNYKRRNADIGEKSKEDAAVQLAEKLLPVLDNFGRAIAAIKDENTLVGIKMIETQFHEALANMKVAKYESMGADFDHNLHDAALMQPCAPEQNGKVIAVMLDGYRYGERVIRAAKVVVGECAE